MSAVAGAPGRAAAGRFGRGVLVPSVVSGVVLGLVAAIVVGVVVHTVAPAATQADDTWVAAYIAWFLFFLVGIGAANYPVKWAIGRPEPTHEEEEQLAGKGQGAWRYFRFCTDHKVVGIQYLVTVLVLFLVGGLASWMIRLEQARSGAKIFTPAAYNTIVGMHGLVMIATTIIMISAAFGNYFVPIMIGANDMAFPRLNALSYWTLFAAIPVLLSAVGLGGFPTGWTGYAPLADQAAAVGMDAYCMTIVLFALSVAFGAVNIFVTVLTMRAPGLSLTRLPVFVWSVVLSTLLGLLVFPAFTAAVLLVLLDRCFGTSFYLASQGGNNFVYEQLFWFMGHPEVYVILLPAVGAICEVITVFSRKPLWGYRLVVGGMIGIFVLSVTVWMHHLYWSGANTPLDTPIMLDTELISIPTGLIFFALVGTLWRGRIRFDPPMLFALAFGVNFLIGGVTGLYLADVPTDTQFHGDMFTVAHFHFTLVGGVVFGFLAALYYWFPKMTGRQLDRRLGQWHFWLFEIGFLGVFIPLFYAGWEGEPRWQAFVAPQFATANLISSLFAIPIIASVAILGYNIFVSWRSGEPAVANQWGGRTLEWMLPSPVPLVNFDRPVVVLAGPYDYGMGGPRLMGQPAVAGAAVDTAPAPSTHPAEASRADRARYGTLLLVLSWTMFGLAIYSAYIYLHALNTAGQFRPASEHPPSTVGTVLITVAAVLGASVWTWGRIGKRGADDPRLRIGMTVGWLITLAGLAGSLVIFATLNYPAPMYAYGSSMALFVFFHSWHLIIGLVIGAMVLGRLYRGRLAGREYTVDCVGYWLWYTAALAVVMMVLTLALS